MLGRGQSATGYSCRVGSPGTPKLDERIASWRSLEALTFAGAPMTGDARRALLTLPTLRPHSLSGLDADSRKLLLVHPRQLDASTPAN